MKQKPRWNVVVLSIIAIACIILTFVVDWLFIIPAVIIWFINQRELSKTKHL